MKSKISAIIATAVFLLGAAASAQALSHTQHFLDPQFFKYEEGEFKFESSLADVSLIIPNDWKVDVGLLDNLAVKSEYTATDPSEVEGEFYSFEIFKGRQFDLLDETKSAPVYSFLGIIDKSILTTEEQLDQQLWYFFGEFVSGGSKGYESIVAIISNEKPNSGAPVPEPATMMMVGAGLLGLAAARRKSIK